MEQSFTMELIRTTATAIEKLKARAKIVKRAEGISHMVALDRVAREAGYDHWQHVQYCIKNGGALIAPDPRTD